MDQNCDLIDGSALSFSRLFMMSRAGLEPIKVIEGAQVIDAINRQIRQNRCFRRFEVHGGYTGCEFHSSGGAR
jgi:hypothetical protein